VGVGETGGDKAQAVHSSTSVDDCRGAGGFERRRDLYEGKTLKGGSRLRLRHEIRLQNLGMLGNR